MPVNILDVGQCGFDGPRMSRLWHEALGATVHDCGTCEAAVQQVRKNKYDIVLVNRILAGNGSSGLEVIRQLVATGTTVPVMLVSDLTEAQDEAVALGAKRGFGKADLGEQSTLDLITRTVGGE